MGEGEGSQASYNFNVNRGIVVIVVFINQAVCGQSCDQYQGELENDFAAASGSALLLPSQALTKSALGSLDDNNTLTQLLTSTLSVYIIYFASRSTSFLDSFDLPHHHPSIFSFSLPPLQSRQ